MQMSSTSWGVAAPGGAVVTPSTLLDVFVRLVSVEACGAGEAQAARPVGRRHLARPERLPLAQPDRGRAGPDQHLGPADPELAGVQPLVGVRDGPELDARAVVGRP